MWDRLDPTTWHNCLQEPPLSSIRKSTGKRRFQKSKREEFPVGNLGGKRVSPSFLTSFSLTQNLMLRLYWNGWEEVLLFQAKPRFKINVYFVELTIFLLYWATKTVSKKSCLNSKHMWNIITCCDLNLAGTVQWTHKLFINIFTIKTSFVAVTFWFVAS